MCVCEERKKWRRVRMGERGERGRQNSERFKDTTGYEGFTAYEKRQSTFIIN